MEIDYRWTSRVAMFGPFHWSIIAFFPLLFATRMSKWAFIALVLYAVLPDPGAAQEVRSHSNTSAILWIRFVYGFKWEVR